MSEPGYSLSKYVFSSSIWMDSADVTACISHQQVYDLVQHLNNLCWSVSVDAPLGSTWFLPALNQPCGRRGLDVPSANTRTRPLIQMNPADVTALMLPQIVRTQPAFEWTQLMSQPGCSLKKYVFSSSIWMDSADVTHVCPISKYVISSSIWIHSADVTAPMCPQVVCDPI